MIGFDEVLPLWMLSTLEVGGLSWSSKEIGEVTAGIQTNQNFELRAKSFIYIVFCLTLVTVSTNNAFLLEKGSPERLCEIAPSPIHFQTVDDIARPGSASQWCFEDIDRLP